MSLDIEGAIKYPLEDDDWIKTVLIGGVLLLFSLFIVPIFAVYGYAVRVIRRTSAGDAEPPAFGGWGDLIVDGLKATVIGLVYQLIPLIVFAVTVGGSIASAATGTDAGTAAALAGAFGGIAVASVLGLIFGYVGVAGILHFAQSGAIGDGFDFGAIKQLITSGDYAVAWLAAIAVNIVVGVIASVIGTVTFGIGGILVLPLQFYALVVVGNLWGQAYASVMGSGGSGAASGGL
jgi:hypothetical protein